MSLGIDLSPTSKQCNFDCLYCELEPAKTVSVQTTSPSIEDVIDEVKTALQKHPNIDVITITANGEPTLYPHLDKLINELDTIKGNAKTLILSNSGTIYNKDIQNILSKLDIVKLSLDCVSSECFKKLDRINSSVDSSKIVNGMIEFRRAFKSDLIIEILFVKTLNDKESEIKLLNNALQQIQPNRIDIGTIDRPPAYDVKPISYEELENIAKSFKNLPVNIAYKNRPTSIQSFTEDEIINLLTLRPLTKEDIENTFDNSSKSILSSLIKKNKVTIVLSGGIEFYKII